MSDFASREYARQLGKSHVHLTSQLTPKPDAFNLGLNDGPAAASFLRFTIAV